MGSRTHGAWGEMEKEGGGKEEPGGFPRVPTASPGRRPLTRQGLNPKYHRHAASVSTVSLSPGQLLAARRERSWLHRQLHPETPLKTPPRPPSPLLDPITSHPVAESPFSECYLPKFLVLEAVICWKAEQPST